jgi:hypothetical protein
VKVPLESLSSDGGRRLASVVSRSSFHVGRRARGEAAATADYMFGRGTAPWGVPSTRLRAMQVCHMVCGKAQLKEEGQTFVVYKDTNELYRMDEPWRVSCAATSGNGLCGPRPAADLAASSCPRTPHPIRCSRLLESPPVLPLLSQSRKLSLAAAFLGEVLDTPRLASWSRAEQGRVLARSTWIGLHPWTRASASTCGSP